MSPISSSKNTMRHLLAALCIALLSPSAHAWWSADWSHRSRLVLDTTATGQLTREQVQALPLAVRLHSGNFDFASAKDDGADLRFVAGDDKTPLAFRIERFDAVNELAVVWVQLPSVAPGSDKNLVYAYAGNAKAALETAPGTGYDAAMLAAFHLGSADGQEVIAGLKSSTPLSVEATGLLGGAARLSGTALVWPASEKLRVPANGNLTLSLWVKPDAAANGVLARLGALALLLQQDGKLSAQLGKISVAGGSLTAGTWSHVALTLGNGQAVLYLNGVSVAQAAAPTPLLEGELRVGDGLQAAIDELQISSVLRSADWLALSVASQGIEGRLVQATLETGDTAEAAGDHGYMGILVKNLTTDAWAVILICALMLVVAIYVMIVKTVLVIRADKANRGFLHRFRSAKRELLKLGLDGQAAQHAESSLFRLYSAGVRELNKRDIGTHADEHEDRKSISGASLNAIKAAVDADMVRESHRLNSQMVLLTIAIAGGPFLGLLGTVVGVMITFAAIAAAGDVNVNAIAPGIASALLATVAGLVVAIPSLFGYNYLASRIKNISADMQIFVDEFITRVAEDYSAP